MKTYFWGLLIFLSFTTSAVAKRTLESNTKKYNYGKLIDSSNLIFNQGDIDTLIIDNNRFFIIKNSFKIDLIDENKNDTICSYITSVENEKQISLHYVFRNKNIIFEEISSHIKFKGNVNVKHLGNNFIFLSQLIHYNSYLPDEFERVIEAIQTKEVFNYLALKKYGIIYRQIATEIDSVYRIRNHNDKFLYDYQFFKLKDFHIMKLFGFYHNSFGEIMSESEPLLLFKGKIKNNTYTTNLNLLSNEKFYSEYQKNNLQFASIQGYAYKGYVTKIHYRYPDSRNVFINTITNKEATKTHIKLY